MFDHHQETEETLSHSNTRANIVPKEDLNGCHLCLSLHNFTLPQGKQLIWFFRHFNPHEERIWYHTRS